MAKQTKSKLLIHTRAYKPQLLTLLVLLGAVGIFAMFRARAASGSMSLIPATSNVSLGSQLVVTIRENSSTDAVNAVQADLSYDQTKLQFVSINTSTSAFDLQAVNSGGNGKVNISRGATVSVTGDQVVALVTFNAIAPGTTAVTIDNTSAIVRTSDTQNMLVTKNNGSYTIADTAAPTIPTGLTSPSKTVNSVSLSWSAATDNVGVTGYKIFRNGTQIGTSTATSFTDTGLAPNTGYNYAVAAYDAAGNTSANSTTLAVTTLPDTTAPSVPSGLTMPSRTMTSISIAWSASTDNVAVTGYRVFRNGTQIGTPTTTTYTDSGLTPGTTYSYRVAAHDAAGNVSAQSVASSFATLPDTAAPSVPTGLNSPTKTSTTISLAWTASTDNVAVTGYRVFRNGTQVGTPTTTSYTDTGLAVGTTYSYTIAAVDAAGNVSAQSAASSFTTTIKPGDVNGDSLVNIFDLSILASNWNLTGATRAQGDLNGDAVVNIFDLSIMAANWGT